MVISMVLGATVDPCSLRRVNMVLTTADGVAVGNFAELVPNLVYIVIDVTRNGRKMKPGCWFVKNKRASTGKVPAGHLAPIDIYYVYWSAYRAIRAHNIYARGWVTTRLSLLNDLNALARACIGSLYNLNNIDFTQFPGLVARLCAAVEAFARGEITDRKLQHTVDMIFRTLTETQAGSRFLGYANAQAQLDRLAERAVDQRDMILTIGTVIAQYMGAVLSVVRGERLKLDVLMHESTGGLMRLQSAQTLSEVADLLERTLIARPTTHVGVRAVRDCRKAAAIIRAVLQNDGDASGVSEGVRNLIGNARDSLDLLLWQEDEEALIVDVAAAVRAHRLLSAEELRQLYSRMIVLSRRIDEPFGSQFANVKTMMKIRNLLERLLLHVDDAVQGRGLVSLENVKTLLTELSDCI